MCMCVGGQGLIYNTVLHISFWGKVSSSLTGAEQTPGILLSPHLQCWDYRYKPPYLALTWIWGLWTQVHMLMWQAFCQLNHLSSTPKPFNRKRQDGFEFKSWFLPIVNYVCLVSELQFLHLWDGGVTSSIRSPARMTELIPASATPAWHILLLESTYTDSFCLILIINPITQLRKLRRGELT